VAWKLNIGIHKGTTMSRDIGYHETKFSDCTAPLECLEDCIETAKQWQISYSRGGYLVYMAIAYGPEGQVHDDIIQLSPYCG